MGNEGSINNGNKVKGGKGREGIIYLFLVRSNKGAGLT